MNTNCMFPIIKYAENKSNKEWGQMHGELFRNAISELVAIRKELMLAKNPKLIRSLDSLAIEQFNFSKTFAPHLTDELTGIAQGSGLSITDIVILNNYTDFRDIILPEEGCSTVHINTPGGQVLSGQTWDMHKSAKNYMCLLQVPRNVNHSEQIILTLVGCIGLMGVNTHNALIGVNNINTTNARPGIIWPVLVRKVVEEASLQKMKSVLLNAPVTSGHNYLISTIEGGEHLEITPTISEVVSSLDKNKSGAIFHTNHCIGLEVQKLEDKTSMSSTTHNRWNLLTSKTKSIKNLDDFKMLLTDHDEFPKSICSHFENGAQDPSFTCGGGASDLTNGTHLFWRGCPTHDSDYKEYKITNSNGVFKIKE